MSILWQTGEPPENVELIARLRWPCTENEFMHFADKCDGKWYVDGMEANGIEVLAWSTLDAAPDVIGRLDAALQNPYPVTIERRERSDGVDYRVGVTRSFGDGVLMDSIRTAPSIAAAIEQLCGGTDGP